MFVYRGQVKYSGNYLHHKEWIEGYYWKDILTEKHFIKYTDIDGFGNILRVLDVEVIEETVSQFTGLVDKYYKRIFGGDILGNNLVTMIIDWSDSYDHCGWVLKRKIDDLEIGEPFMNKNFQNCEILGNKFDNPQLLQGINK